MWLARAFRAPRAAARSAAGSSQAAPSASRPGTPTGGSSPCRLIQGPAAAGADAASCACPGGAGGSSAASGTDFYGPGDYYEALYRIAAERGIRPPPLGEISADAKLAVAPVRGANPEEWTPAAEGAFIAWPGVVGAGHAELMTAGQLRAELARRDRP